MSLNTQNSPAGAPARPTGFRRLSLPMLDARNRADGFQGVPQGTARPLTYLAAFQEAEPYLGLPAHAFKLVSWLVKQTFSQDWEAGSRPVAWPSARRQQEFLGLSPARVKALNRALFELGIFVLRDNEQGKRYGRRDKEGRILEAYGFDLSPLALRHEEFIRLAAEAKIERTRMKDLRRRVTLARRAIRQAGELLTSEGPLPALFTRLAREAADLVDAARLCHRSDELALAAKRLESLQAQAEQLVRQSMQSSETTSEGLAGKPHTTPTNPPEYLEDTVLAAEGSSEVARPLPSSKPLAERKDAEGVPSRVRLSVEELVLLVPRLGQYLGRQPGWREAIDAAGGPLRQELGISPSLWGEACVQLGREAATLALAIVATKGEGHFTRSAGGYFAGMVRKAAKGELFLEKSIWGLRQARYGRPEGKAN